MVARTVARLSRYTLITRTISCTRYVLTSAPILNDVVVFKRLLPVFRCFHFSFQIFNEFSKFRFRFAYLINRRTPFVNYINGLVVKYRSFAICRVFAVFSAQRFDDPIILSRISKNCRLTMPFSP